MTVVPMGINLDLVEQAKTLRFSDTRLDGKLVLLYVGTMSRTRKLELLIRMLCFIKINTLTSFLF